MISIQFSMVGPRLSKEEAAVFAGIAEWCVINQREARLLVDGIGQATDIPTIFAALDQAGRDPVIIGAWDEAGVSLTEYPLNLEAWLLVAPDAVDYSDPDNPVISRPTEWTELHQWAGWAERTLGE